MDTGRENFYQNFSIVLTHNLSFTHHVLNKVDEGVNFILYLFKFCRKLAALVLRFMSFHSLDESLEEIEFFYCLL